MSKSRLVITAVTLEKRPISEVARTYGVARSWIYKLLDRYRTEGDAAFEPHSRRPKTSPNATNKQSIELILSLRQQLADKGLDAGPETIAWHLQHHHQITISRTTISRYLVKSALVVPSPHKRPKSSYIRFQDSLPNETWQADFTHYPLADGSDCEILSFLDDHSRFALSLSAHRHVTGSTVLHASRNAIRVHGAPASTLTDNGMIGVVGCERHPINRKIETGLLSP
jgi:transposase InsO family protein